MSDERRYTEQEIERIFEAAARERRALTSGPTREGLTLAELQAIGGEVGMPPERIAEAAALLDREPTVPRRIRSAGIPVGVRTSFELPDEPIEREWAMIVAELRRTFEAEGSVRTTNGLREWRNGNLHAVVEPTESGYRLRLGTRKGQAPALALSSAFLFLIAFGAFDDGGIVGPIVLVILALLCVAQLLRLPQWADLREEQMEHMGEFAQRLIGSRMESSDPAT